MEHVTFLSGSWWWVKDYPTVEPVILETEWKKTITEYKQAIIYKALEGKVEVAPEDQDKVKAVIWETIFNKDNVWIHIPLAQWIPHEDKVYEVDLEMEIKGECWCNGTELCYTGPDEKHELRKCDLRQVARIKPVKEELLPPPYEPPVTQDELWKELEYLIFGPDGGITAIDLQRIKNRGFILLKETEPTKHEGKERWRVESETSQIADTGDYHTQDWLTNGKMTLAGNCDESDLQKIADSLNR